MENPYQAPREVGDPIDWWDVFERLAACFVVVVCYALIGFTFALLVTVPNQIYWQTGPGPSPGLFVGAGIGVLCSLPRIWNEDF